MKSTTHRQVIIQSLAKKPFLRTKHLYSAIDPNRLNETGWLRNLRDVFRDLENHGAIGSLLCVDSFKKSANGLAHFEKVYFLKPKGISVGLEKKWLTEEDVNFAVVREERPSRTTLLHNTDNTDNILALEKWGREKGYGVSSRFKGISFEVADSARKYYTPDATIRFQKSEKEYISFVLETEESEPNDYEDKKPGVVRKAIYLLRILRTDLAKQVFGFSEFRVLFVCKTPEIKAKILRAMRFHMEQPGTFTFWHNASKKYESLTKPSRTFWFTSQDELQKDTGGKIWQTPADYELGIYYSLNDC